LRHHPDGAQQVEDDNRDDNQNENAEAFEVHVDSSNPPPPGDSHNGAPMR
jgi:hypothetical protein